MSTGTASRTWQLENCPFLVECSRAVLEEIYHEVERACGSRHVKHETGGVLYGVHEPERVHIMATRVIPCEYAVGPGFVLSEKDEKRLAQLISAPERDPALKGLEVLGWYHSHVRSRIFLSGRDQQIHSRYFGAPYQLAIVIHPSSEGSVRGGFFFRESSGEMRTQSSYEEFSLEAPATVTEPPATSQERKKHRRAPAGAEPTQDDTVCPNCGSRHIRRSHKTGVRASLGALFGYSPYRCSECLSRVFLKDSPALLERTHSRPEVHRRKRERTRRELLLWGGGILFFLVALYYITRESMPKSSAP